MDLIKLNYIDIFDNNEKKELIFSDSIIKTQYKKESLFAVLVDGESMEPVINNQAVIVADLSQKELENDGIYLLNYDNRMWVKKYDLKEKQFISINSNFSHLVYKQDDVHLVARVILTFTNL